MGNKTRVVVTGLGAITPVGNDVASFWQGLKDKKVGIAPITYFDTTDYKAKLAGEVKDFDPKKYMDPKAARRMEPFSQYAVAAAGEAIAQAGLDMEKEDPFRVGTSIGSGIGSLQAMEAIKYILGVGKLLTGYLLTYDAINQEFHKVKLPSNTDGCAVCGKHPTITELIDYEQVVCTDGI